MKQYWLLMALLLCGLYLPANQLETDAQEIATALAGYIQTDLPVFLSVHAGEYTPFLAEKLQQILLDKAVDLRDYQILSGLETESGSQMATLLSQYGISAANLAQVDLNLQWENIEHKSFFSYRNERRLLYSFSLKQSRLPQHQIIQIDSYNFSPAGHRDNSISAPRLRWFEPLIAGTALASIIFLLWTIE